MLTQASLWHCRDVTHIFEHKLYEFINNHLKLKDMELQVNERSPLMLRIGHVSESCGTAHKLGPAQATADIEGEACRLRDHWRR